MLESKKSTGNYDSSNGGDAINGGIAVKDDIKVYSNPDNKGDLQLGMERTISVSEDIDDHISQKDSATIKFEDSINDWKLSAEGKNSVAIRTSEKNTLTLEESIGTEIGKGKSGVSRNIRLSDKYDVNDNNYVEKSFSEKQGISIDKDTNLKISDEMGTSTKVGNDEYNAEESMKQTSSINTNGTVSYGGEVGTSVHAGRIEGGFKHSNEVSGSAESESYTDKDEVSVGFHVSDNINVKQTGSIENKESESVHGDVFTKETESNTVLKTEIEVNPDAPIITKVVAGIVNLEMGIINTSISDVLSEKSKTEVRMLDSGPQLLLLDAGKEDLEIAESEKEQQEEKLQNEIETVQEENDYEFYYGMGY